MSSDFPDLTADEQRLLAEIQGDCARAFARRYPRSAFLSVLEQIRAFVHSGDAEAQARRADACGLIWMSHGIAVNTRRLPRVLGKGRSWINERFAQLGYAPAAKDRLPDIAIELARALGRRRCGAQEAAHWTYRCPAPVDIQVAEYQGIVAGDAVLSEGHRWGPFEEEEFP
jgi:hypothetical protein